MNQTETKFPIETTLEVHDIALEQIKKCQEFFEQLEDAEEAMRLYKSLKENLQRLDNMNTDGQGKLFKDFAPLSFSFLIRGIQGGLIFHGPADGYGNGSAPTFSVCLEPTHGWSIHT